MKRSLKSYIRQPKILLPLTLILFMLSVLLSLMIGTASASPREFLHALFSFEDGSILSKILLHVRFPRVLAAALVGMALSVSGALLQTTLHNPLAAPNLIGVNAGAGVGVLFTLAFLPTLAMFMPVAAFLGALIATLLVYFIASRAGAARLTLVLAGIAVSSFLGAVSDTIITLFPSTQASRISFLIGGFAGISMAQVLAALPVILLGLIGAWILAFDLNTLALGDEIAASLGVRVRLIRFLALLAAALLAGGAVSLAGLLGFVGLIVPHIARRIIGEDLRVLIPLCMLLGGAFTLFCDLLSRILFAPFEIPVGILLSFIGAPFFIYLLLREKRHAKS